MSYSFSSFSTSNRGKPETKTDEFLLSPTCPIFRGSTVVHSVLTPNREILV